MAESPRNSRKKSQEVTPTMENTPPVESTPPVENTPPVEPQESKEADYAKLPSQFSSALANTFSEPENAKRAAKALQSEVEAYALTLPETERKEWEVRAVRLVDGENPVYGLTDQPKPDFLADVKLVHTVKEEAVKLAERVNKSIGDALATNMVYVYTHAISDWFRDKEGHSVRELYSIARNCDKAEADVYAYFGIGTCSVDGRTRSTPESDAAKLVTKLGNKGMTPEQMLELVRKQLGL